MPSRSCGPVLRDEASSWQALTGRENAEGKTSHSTTLSKACPVAEPPRSQRTEACAVPGCYARQPPGVENNVPPMWGANGRFPAQQVKNQQPQCSKRS